MTVERIYRIPFGTVGNEGQMGYPTSVKIGPYRFAVEVEDRFIDHGDKYLWGRIEYEPVNKIRLYKHCSPDRGWTIFFHECLHGLSDLVNANLSEDQVSQLAPALFAFLVENELFNRL